jgi:hypothetical protein
LGALTRLRGLGSDSSEPDQGRRRGTRSEDDDEGAAKGDKRRRYGTRLRGGVELELVCLGGVFLGLGVDSDWRRRRMSVCRQGLSGSESAGGTHPVYIGSLCGPGQCSERQEG